MKYVYLYRLENEDEDKHPIALTRPYAIALIVLVLGVILLGTVFAPWFSYSNAAGLLIFFRAEQVKEGGLLPKNLKVNYQKSPLAPRCLPRWLSEAVHHSCIVARWVVTGKL